MSEDTKLLEKREELKRQLQNGEFDLLPTVILNRIGRIIQRLTRSPEPLSSWYSTALITFLLVSIWALTLLTQHGFACLPECDYVYYILAITIVAGFSMNVASKSTLMLFSTLRESTLDSIQSVQDLEDLHSSLAALSNLRGQLFLSLLYVLFDQVLVLPHVLSANNLSLTFELGVSNITLRIVISFLFYVFIWYLVLMLRLREYQFKLYSANPSRSTVIAKLSDRLGRMVLYAAAGLALGTLINLLWQSKPSDEILIAILMLWWTVILTAFFSYQSALEKIITHAKWRTLDDIQSKVEQLQAMQHIPDKDTLEQIRSLMDYHDHIEATPNSFFSLREILLLVQSLLLPLIAFVLGNIEQVLAWLRG